MMGWIIVSITLQYLELAVEIMQRKYIDEDMLEKLILYFHASDVFLQQEYQEKGFDVTLN